MLRRALILLVAAGFVFTVLAAPAAAGGRDTTRLERDLAALQKQVNALAKTVDHLKTQLAAEKHTSSGLRAQVDLILANPVLDLGDYVAVEPDAVNGVVGPNIIFTGANLHLRSGSGSTSDGAYDFSSGSFDPSGLSGLGNLIVGYNEGPEYPETSRHGSHNIVLGSRNGFSGFSGFVGGEDCSVTAPFSVVLTGFTNHARGRYSVVSGGVNNSVSGEGTSISGGTTNEAGGYAASVTGGSQNVAGGTASTVAGGNMNGAGGIQTIVAGGRKNTASGHTTSLFGGFHSGVSGDFEATITGGEFLYLSSGWGAGYPGSGDEPWTPITAYWFRTGVPE